MAVKPDYVLGQVILLQDDLKTSVKPCYLELFPWIHSLSVLGDCNSFLSSQLLAVSTELLAVFNLLYEFFTQFSQLVPISLQFLVVGHI